MSTKRKRVVTQNASVSIAVVFRIGKRTNLTELYNLLLSNNTPYISIIVWFGNIKISSINGYGYNVHYN